MPEAELVNPLNERGSQLRRPRQALSKRRLWRSYLDAAKSVSGPDELAIEADEGGLTSSVLTAQCCGEAPRPE